MAAPDEALHGLGALYRLYPTAAGWVFLAAPGPADWPRLLAALGPAGAELAADPRYATALDRRASDDALAQALAAVFSGAPAVEWEQRLLAAGVGCVRAVDGPVEGPLQSDELGGAAGLLTVVEDPTFGEIPRLTPLVSLSRTPGSVGPAPALGQHTDQVLTELGYRPEEIAALRAQGVLAGAPAV
jgi:crotonobetainyl-CoA:carnitine CoA-transferase CaiB-like acyl-CoA transferase